MNTQTSENIEILISTPGKPVVVGKYALSSDKYLVGYYDSPLGRFVTGNGTQGEVEIIKLEISDKTKSQIVGKFNYSCFNSKANKTTNITEGNFTITNIKFP